ncbi:MAG: hypothetical protein M3460_04530 [Actinomycetota bacterium]|nr:hypothetical protein [Actinomycetota bacterium]
MIELTSAPEPDTPEDEIELFSIDGVAYTIPAKPRVNVALKYLWHVRQYGEDRAAAELMESLLGPKGFQALVEYDDLQPEQFGQILTIAQQHVLGALEGVRGNSVRGSVR